jgi:hypothetical protein
MEQARADNVIVMPQQPNDWSKLIRKLRWIGLEEEAHRLQLKRCVVCRPNKEAPCQPGRLAPTK